MTNDIELLRIWLRIVIIVASLCATSLPIMYSFSRWAKSGLGRAFMLLSSSLAAAMDIQVMFMFWRPPILVMFWANAIVITGIAIATVWLTWWVWKMNFSRRNPYDVQR